ncbi:MULTISPECIES: cupin domain-containing protein [unclassified Pantoea]|uniref:cupin domain-containing protein n=1 Tax=unclassified Pantoea TaxID=2630326 RepID=UPI000908097B|nr:MULTISPECIES: cupin domain-containing protein [unclassified Pantoea]
MDPLSDVLQLLAAQSSVTTGQSAGSHWSMRYPGFEGMKFISIRKGHLWFRLDEHVNPAVKAQRDGCKTKVKNTRSNPAG